VLTATWHVMTSVAAAALAGCHGDEDERQTQMMMNMMIDTASRRHLLLFLHSCS